MRAGDQCNINGCYLASAFFPDPESTELVIYPKMFTQSRKEQVDTLVRKSALYLWASALFCQY